MLPTNCVSFPHTPDTMVSPNVNNPYYDIPTSLTKQTQMFTGCKTKMYTWRRSKDSQSIQQIFPVNPCPLMPPTLPIKLRACYNAPLPPPAHTAALRHTPVTSVYDKMPFAECVRLPMSPNAKFTIP